MTHEELVQTVSILQDRQAINDCLMRYSRGVDRLDRELLLSVYHEDAIDDHGVFVGNPEQFADWVVAMHTATHLSHQHCIFNISVDLQGDQAHVESYYMFVGLNRTGTPLAMSGGRYLDLDRNPTGIYELDFNRAYHPYCYYNATYECPLPPRENRLKIPIHAGERMKK